MTREAARLWQLDEAAVLRAIEQRGLRVALDVYQGEPAAPETPFESGLRPLAHPAAAQPRRRRRTSIQFFLTNETVAKMCAGPAPAPAPDRAEGFS